MKIKRRNFLVFLGGSAGAILLGCVPRQKKLSMPFMNPAVQASVTPGQLSFRPIKGPMPLETLDDGELYGQGNVFGLAGNKYGPIIEVDPANPQDYGTKHTWLGRYRHEAVGVRVESGKQLALYSGCFRRGGHIYKFVSRDRIRNPQDKTNSQLLKQGMLYAAKFNSDGTGRWIPLKADASVNPDSPNNIEVNLVRLPLRHSDKEEEGYFQRQVPIGSYWRSQRPQRPAETCCCCHS